MTKLADAFCDFVNETSVAIRGLTSGLPPDVDSEADQLGKRKLAFCRRDGVIVQVRMDKKKTCANDTSTLHEETVVKAERNNKRTVWKWRGEKNPLRFSQHNKFLRGCR